MNLDKFPPVYKVELDNRTQLKLSDEERRSYQQKESIKRLTGAKPDGANWVLGCGMVGFVIGFFTCMSNCEAQTFGEAFGPWFWLTVIGLSIGGIASGFVNKQYDENVHEMEIKISNEEKNSQLSRENILKDAEREFEQYLTLFESTAQSMGVQFAESQLAIEVVEWMTNGFIKTIDAADRRSHIEKINIPFNFNVYADKITCNLGTFDFEIKRCRNLHGPLEQAALSRAIAAAIQLNITMKYPKDISGTDIVTNIGYAYSDDHVSTNVVYTADNGNYEFLRDWK